jgi:type III secretion protein R
MKGELPLLLALLPLLLLAAACFLKFSVVLSLLARALGGRALPSLAVGGAALLLAAFVLAPVAEQAVGAASGALARGDLVDAAGKAADPVRSFLERQVPLDARKDLLELQRGLRPVETRAKVSDRDLVVLGPAFAIAELKTAFRIGFFLLLPFLVIDLLVAVVLLALGMHTLDARVLALPCKLLLFVAVDGWALLARGLLLGYTGT